MQTRISRPASPEYDAARNGAVVVDRTDRVVLRVSGRDPVRMLHGLVTNDLAGAAEGACVYAAFLTPKGRMVADARLIRTGAAVLVELAKAAEEPLREHLRKYVPPLFARVEEAAGFAVIGVYGAAHETIARITGSGDVAWLELPPVDVPPAEGIDLIVPVEARAAEIERLMAAGAMHAALDTVELLRIEAGLPAWGPELNETVIPLEAGLKERAISTTKGCYTGQEVIIRILHRGHVNRQLRGLLLEGAQPPLPGSTITLPGQERAVGSVTSATVSPATGRTLAMAYLRREVDLGATVEVEGAPATVVAVPGWRMQDAKEETGPGGAP